ncbi:hypothetical protein CS111_004824, partial [Escherichia coli]|nr:hypothetical protein [Escherichia coli]EFB4929164.1 hypothetical protein [Escherichia coli]EFH1309176.1 hypothetical protein [Escherichia coli]EFL7737122.1 hypothetical protein [Escherichia coli]EFL8954516.1 hypothetical protein [Escherichia coli]
PPPVRNESSRPLPDVAQRLIQHLAEHGITPPTVDDYCIARAI